MLSPLLSSLELVCTACDQLNPSSSQQCLACGAPLIAGAKVASNRSSSPAKPNPPALSARQEGTQASVQATAASQPTKPSAAQSPPEVSAEFGPAFFVTVIAGSAKGQRYRVPSAGCAIGRTGGGILFPEDVFVSGRHATLLVRKGQLHVRDDASASGVFVSIKGQQAIPRGAMFSAGQRLFRFRGPLEAGSPAPGPRPYGTPVPAGRELYAIEEVLSGGRPGKVVVGSGPALTIGQMDCHFAFPKDEDLAGRHCELTPTDKGAVLRDLSGGLGTLARIASGTAHPLSPGDRLRVGQQLLRVDQQSEKSDRGRAPISH
jgi:pSer/pThr/pTyr-binding forkhead associated (FHA) protein